VLSTDSSSSQLYYADSFQKVLNWLYPNQIATERFTGQDASVVTLKTKTLD